MCCYQALPYKYSEMLGVSMYRDKKLKNVEVLIYIALLANVGISAYIAIADTVGKCYIMLHFMCIGEIA